MLDSIARYETDSGQLRDVQSCLVTDKIVNPPTPSPGPPSQLWAPLNPACQDASFGTLQCTIGHTVPEILSAGKIPEEEQEEEQEQEEYITFLRD